MKIYIIIFCLFLSISAYSQISDHANDTTKSSKSDSAKHILIIRDARTLNLGERLLIVVDYIPYTGNLKNIDIAKILKVDTLKGVAATALYGSMGSNGVVEVTTKTYAITVYQKKLSKFSRRYSKYLINNHNDDSSCFYVINGEPIQGKENDIISRLFNIPSNKIKSVACADVGDQWRNGNNTKQVIAIVTRQN